MTAKSRYDRLSSDRSQFLNTARQAADLTLPYLIREDEVYHKGSLKLITPWQSVGAKGVVTLASKLMLALLPPQTSFFKLQINDLNLNEQLGPEIRSELDMSFAKVERTIMESIAASSDRVVIHQALKHLVVAGNALIFMGKDGLKLYPLNRYAVDRDGNGNVIEIVTKETISKKLLKKFYPDYQPPQPNHVSEDSSSHDDECDIYTHATLDNNRWIWHQEVDGQVLPKSMSKAPVDANPWLVLRFNHVDGEVYGRGRVEEFIGDLKSLEALSQAVVEGSAAAAKVVFTVSPSSTTKPATLAKAGNGAIIQGRPDDIGVVQVGKTADFQTAYQMIGTLTQRLSDAFLVLNVRDSERTTAEEVRMTQLELEQQLGGLFSLLTVEFLVPYLNRKLSVAQKTGEIPRLPKGDIVKPAIVAGINALGRGQDRESLSQFLTVIAQTMGPEAIQQFINPEEVVKRLAAASGIDALNLVKSMQEVQEQQQMAMQQQQQMAMTQQAGQLAAVEQRREQAQLAEEPTTTEATT
jgi:hypothetical protein